MEVTDQAFKASGVSQGLENMKHTIRFVLVIIIGKWIETDVLIVDNLNTQKHVIDRTTVRMYGK